ncbi:hypothetical protein G6F65_020719 [Rhizopus arrhizus]|nr:hypothetical protein G6F65_020719 [Rhizopus arrhizus]
MTRAPLGAVPGAKGASGCSPGAAGQQRVVLRVRGAGVVAFQPRNPVRGVSQRWAMEYIRNQRPLRRVQHGRVNDCRQPPVGQAGDDHSSRRDITGRVA